MLIHLCLLNKDISVGILLECLVSLQLNVIIITESLFIPQYPLLCFFEVSVHDKLRNLSSKACRAYDQSFPVESELRTVSTRFVVIAVGPGFANEFYKVMVTYTVFSQDY